MLLFAAILSISAAYASAPQSPCDGSTYEKQSKALRETYKADQADREDFEHWKKGRAFKVMERDRARRKKVADIFAEGCLKSADDYFHAATVFQHGEVPDHFFQTYIWASKAFRMNGRAEAGIMAARRVDGLAQDFEQRSPRLRELVLSRGSEGCFERDSARVMVGSVYSHF